MLSRKVIFGIIALAGIGFFLLPTNKTASNIPITIVAFGDSLTAGFGIPEDDSYPSYLRARLQEEGITNATVINLGVSGDTTRDGLTRINEVLDAKPDVVILALGANDMLRRLPTQETEQNLRQIIAKLKEKNITVILAGMRPPLGLGGTFGDQFEALYPTLAQEFSLPFIPYFLRGVALRTDLNISDGIHPNKEGYKRIVDENILPVLLESLRNKK